MILLARRGVRTQLLTNATLNHATTGVNSQWYWQMARGREGTDYTFPYGVMSLAAGGQSDASAVEQGDIRLLLKIVGKISADFAESALSALAQEIKTSLHETQDTWSYRSNDNGYIWRSQIITYVEYTELDGEVEYVHVGGIYRIRISK